MRLGRLVPFALIVVLVAGSFWAGLASYGSDTRHLRDHELTSVFTRGGAFATLTSCRYRDDSVTATGLLSRRGIKLLNATNAQGDPEFPFAEVRLTVDEYHRDGQLVPAPSINYGYDGFSAWSVGKSSTETHWDYVEALKSHPNADMICELAFERGPRSQ